MKNNLIPLWTLLLALPVQSQVSPPDAVINGQTIPEWTAEWWKWVYAQPTNASALFDTDGSQATNSQRGGGVFFVANIATPGTVTRTFSVPEGSYLLFPVRYVTLDNVAFVVPLSVAQLRDAASGVVDLMTNLHASIDGQAVDVSSHRVLSPVFSFNFPDANNLDSFLNGVDVTGLVDPIVSDGYWIMLNPLPMGTHTIDFGGDIGPPYNSSKQVTDYITVVPAKHPPVADASATRLRYVAATNGNAKIVLDGSRSSDPNNDALTYRWLETESLLSQAPLATNVLAAGSHQIDLIVSDGSLSASNIVTVLILTIPEALDELKVQVLGTGLSPKKLRTLLEPLDDAVKHLRKGQHHAAIHQLREFQEEVREQRADLTLAESAQEIANAILEGPVTTPAVLPNDAVVDGRSLSEWTAEFWKWIWLQPTNQHVLLDPDGRWATNAQPEGSVFFVSGVLDLQGNASRTRAFTILEDKELFIGLAATAPNNIDTFPPLSINELRATAAIAIDAVTELHATVDGVAVPDLFQRRLMSPVYSYFLPDANNLNTIYYGHPVTGLIDPEVSDGYWLMLAPLSPGVHVIDWGAVVGPPYNFSAPFTDIVTVVPLPLSQRVEKLISSVTSSGLSRKRQHELLQELREARKHFVAVDLREGIEEMKEFQKKVRHEVGPLDQTLADQLIQAAQIIIDKATGQLP